MAKISNESENSKWERINQIYARLINNTSGVTITDLAKELDVSTKTIQRDLHEVLASHGAVKCGRFWKIDPSLASDSLAPKERVIIAILDEMAKGGGRAFYGKAHSLLAQITQQLEHPIFANLDSESLEEAHIESFEKIENSIKTKMEIEFDYKQKHFQVKPLKLAFFDGFWYLLTLDTNDFDQFKKFHLKSISNLSFLNQTFTMPQLVEDRLKKANSIWFDLSEEFDVKLLVSKDIAKFFERKPLKGQSITGKDADGSIEITLAITNEMEIMPLIQWYMPHIKVLEPDWLADSIKAKVSAYLSEIQ